MPRAIRDDNFGLALNVRRKAGVIPNAVRDLSFRDSPQRFKPKNFAKRTGSIAKLLIALASLPSRILISRTFANSRNGSRHAGPRATLPVKQTEIKRRTPPRKSGGRFR
jgi:hypothetical protein